MRFLEKLGSRPTGPYAALIALAFVAVQGHAAEPHKREWVVVPGHKNIMVDIASVAPMSKDLEGPRLPGQRFGEMTDPVPTERTAATIRLNGHIFTSYMMICSGFGAWSSQEVTVEFPQPWHPGQPIPTQPPRIMGHVPGGAVEALACPVARAKVQARNPKSN